MEKEIKIPEVGESVSEVTIAEWLKKDGDYIERDEPVCEIDSDKASFEIPSDEAGTLKILVKEGETVAVGDTIAKVDTSKKKAEKKTTGNGKKGKNESKDEKEKSEEPKWKSAQGPFENGRIIDVKIPEVGESITEVTINHWLKENGDYVEKDEPICEIDSDKASFEIPADEAGQISILKKEGESAEIGEKIAQIEAKDKPDEVKETETVAKEEEKEVPSEKEKHYKISPVAEKILAESGILAVELKGSGAGGRITKEDALRAVEKQETDGKTMAQEKVVKEQEAPQPDKKEKAPQKVAAESERRERREKMSTLRKTISRRLVAAKNETAMLTTFNEVDMQEIMSLRKKYKEAFKEKYDVSLGFMSFFIKAVCNAVKDWPAINARIDEEDIVYQDYCDISIAVSTPKGLVTPVIRNADRLTLAELETEVLRLAEKARAGKLSIEEMTGGTFTISNGGVFGSLMATPILNPPQSAILGMHKIQERPVVVNGQIVIRPMMYVALSYDHRIVDGRESVSYLVRVKEMLEDPGRLLLEI